MKQKIILMLSVTLYSKFVAAEISTLPLCHADPMYSEYNYGGIWERDEDDEWVCNFWQFLSEGHNERPTTMIGAEESEESDFYINPQDAIPDIIEYYDDGG